MAIYSAIRCDASEISSAITTAPSTTTTTEPSDWGRINTTPAYYENATLPDSWDYSNSTSMMTFPTLARTNNSTRWY